MNSIEPGEKALVISSNCRAFTAISMHEWLKQNPQLLPKQLSWWEKAVMGFFELFFGNGALF